MAKVEVFHPGHGERFTVVLSLRGWTLQVENGRGSHKTTVKAEQGFTAGLHTTGSFSFCMDSCPPVPRCCVCMPACVIVRYSGSVSRFALKRKVEYSLNGGVILTSCPAFCCVDRKCGTCRLCAGL
jgi:hypothetical protein